MDEIAKILGLDFDLLKALSKRKLPKEMEILTKQREAVRQIDNVRKIRDKMENLIS